MTSPDGIVTVIVTSSDADVDVVVDSGADSEFDIVYCLIGVSTCLP